MKQFFQYIYYRIAKSYKNIFGIEEAPGFLLIQSCYSWGLLVLVTILCVYVLALETIVLWWFGVKTNNWHIIITFIPFGLFYFFAEHFIGDLRIRYKALEERYKNEKLSWLKGIGVFLFVVFAFVSYFVTLSQCR